MGDSRTLQANAAPTPGTVAFGFLGRRGGDTRGAARKWTLILLAVAGCGLASPVSVGAIETRLQLQENCAYRLLPNRAVLLTSNLKINYVSGTRVARVRVTAGWTFGPAHVRAPAISLRLRPGEAVPRVVSRRIDRAPLLWSALYAKERLRCASRIAYELV